MVLKYRFLGKGYTDENGVAHMTEDADGQSVSGYTGTGRGLTDVVASTDDKDNIKESSLQSIPYSITDCKFYDIGTTGTLRADWYYSGGTFVSSSTGLKITNNTSISYVVAPNISGNTTNPTITEMCLFTDGTCCEFNIVGKTATIDLQTRNTNGNLSHHYLTSVTGTHVVLTYQDGAVVVKVDGTSIGTYEQTGDVMIRISVINGYLEFKDFEVYSI